MFKTQLHVISGPMRPGPEVCSQVAAIGMKYPVRPGEVRKAGSQTADAEIRRSEIRWIPRTEGMVAGLIRHYAEFANRDSFGVEASAIFDIQFATYRAENQGHYDWHHDVSFSAATPYMRKLSFIMQLSDGAEYEGGDIQFEPHFVGDWTPEKAAVIRQQGTVLVFPSFFLHRVTPVTKGERKSLVSWVEGPPWR